MALINCPECGKEISDSVKKCIHCGYNLKKKKLSIVCPECGSNDWDSKKRRCNNCGYKEKVGVWDVVNKILFILILIIIVGLVLFFCIKKNNTPVASRDVCNVVGCEKDVYTNSLCMDHYLSYKHGDTLTYKNGGSSQSEKEIANVDDKQAGFEEDKRNVTTINKNSTVRTDSCEFTLTGYVIEQKIEPDNTDAYYYHYYEAGSGNVFVDVKFKIKNLSSSAVKQNSILNKVTIIYDDVYEYNCSFVTVGNDGDFEGFTSLYGINPLETMDYHLLAEVPIEVKNSGKRIVCRIEVDDYVCECVLR